MTTILDVVDYPEEGFGIITDTQGSYLIFRDREDIVPLDEGPLSRRGELINLSLTQNPRLLEPPVWRSEIE